MPIPDAKLLRLVVRHTHQRPDWADSLWRSTRAAGPSHFAKMMADQLLADGTISDDDYHAVQFVALRYFLGARDAGLLTT